MKSFVKRVVRTPIVALPVALPRAIVEASIDHPLPRRAVSQEETSGLTPVEISVVLGTFLVVFIICLFVGLLCKVFNRPTAEAHPYYPNGNLYQPSAAGYGVKGGPGSNAAARQEAANAGPTMLSVEGAYGSRTSLLGAASPMGAGGGGYGSPTVGGGGTTDYFATGLSANNHGRSASSNLPALPGHSRGESSGIRMPGPSAAARRPGAQGASHPALPGGGPSPDGGGFKPGQVFNHPSGPGFSGPQLRAAPRGPPPATDARRRSRYTRADGRRIDSVGPGVYRKSMYMPDDGAGAGGAGNGGGNAGGLGAGLRRVDSVGRGDARRRSQAVLGGQRAPSVYAVGTDRATLRSAQADNFGAGRAPAPQRTPSSDRSDPLGANRNFPSAGAPGSGPPGAALQAGPRVRQQPQHQQHPMPPHGGGGGYATGPPQHGMPNGQPGPRQQMMPQARGPPRPGGPPMPPYAAAPSHPGMGGPMGQYAQPQLAGGVGRQIL